MPKTDKTDSPQKSDHAVTCWITEHEFEEMGRECSELVKNLPGARLSRSAFLAGLYREHVKSKAKGKAES